MLMKTMDLVYRPFRAYFAKSQNNKDLYANGWERRVKMLNKHHEILGSMIVCIYPMIFYEKFGLNL